MGMFDEMLCNHELFGEHKGRHIRQKICTGLAAFSKNTRSLPQAAWSLWSTHQKIAATPPWRELLDGAAR